MDRKNFIKTCGMACVGVGALSALLQSCGITKTITGSISDSDLMVALTDFETRAGNKIYYKKYVMVYNEKLQYPICVYRFDEKNYSALWMKCTHQGAELQVFGDKLQCPAHGSEFTNKGELASGPAALSLRSFLVTIEKNQLKISLKAI